MKTGIKTISAYARNLVEKSIIIHETVFKDLESLGIAPLGSMATLIGYTQTHTGIKVGTKPSPYQRRPTRDSPH